MIIATLIQFYFFKYHKKIVHFTKTIMQLHDVSCQMHHTAEQLFASHEINL